MMGRAQDGSGMIMLVRQLVPVYAAQAKVHASSSHMMMACSMLLSSTVRACMSPDRRVGRISQTPQVGGGTLVLSCH
jgi:hypothetical protein